MIFKCKNCGANTVWSPEQDRMCCPHCDSIDSEELVTTENEYQCPLCGAPVEPKPYDSALKCEHCGAYMIFDERIRGKYEPHLIIPFKISKSKAKEIIREQFDKKIFLPTGFLKEASLEKMEGDYIPFFLFDIHCHYRYSARAQKVKKWVSGNTEYTETSVYQLYRTMDADFNRVPTDASETMPDNEMDLLEPFDYSSMYAFQPKFMSGFRGELYSVDGPTLEPRAKAKVRKDAVALMQETIGGYSSVVPECDDCQCQTKEENYALLPVWNYKYRYRGKEYLFRLNGETGKLIGKAPLSVGKMIGCAATVFSLVTAMGYMLRMILEVF